MARTSSSPARSATRKPSSNTRRAGRRRGPISASSRSRTELARLRQGLGSLRRGRACGELRYHFGREQAHGLLRLAEIERAEIDLQRGVLESADRFDDAGDDGLDLFRRADPRSARGDLAVERERAQPAHRFVVVAVILRGRAPCPIAHRLVERAEIFLEWRARDLAREPRILMTEHMERHHHLAVTGMAGLAPGFAIEIDQRPDRADWNRHQRIALAAGELERLRRLRRRDVEFGARALRRSRQRGHALEGMEVAAVSGVLLRQQEFDLFEALAEARLRFIGRDAEAAEFVRKKRARKSDVEPPARNAVEHRDFAGELERVVEYGQHRAGDEAHRPRALRYGGEENDWIGAVAAITGEIVLDSACVGKAQSFRFL